MRWKLLLGRVAFGPRSVAIALGRRFHFERKVRTRGHRHQHLFLAIDQRGSVIAGDLETVPVGDVVGRAKYAATVPEIPKRSACSPLASAKID